MSDNRPLQGLRILITRPGNQGDALARCVEQAGGEPVVVPLLDIEPVVDEAALAEVRERIQNLDHYQLLIFISSNAARFGLDWIDRYWPQFPDGIDVVAVGPATAEVLRSLPCEILYSATGMSSEDILNLPRLVRVDGQKIALFRGVGGRELLATTLRERGAQVDPIEIYRREVPAGRGLQLSQMLDQAAVDMIVVTSGQILDSLCSLVDSKHSGIDLVPLLVPSQRVADQALVAGFNRVINCDGATDEVILKALTRVAGQIRGR